MENLRMSICLAVIFALAGSSPTIWAGAQNIPVDESIEGLKREIRVLNLVNGLNLTPEQMDRILSLARRAEGCRAEFRKTVGSFEEEEGRALEEIGSFLRLGLEIPQNTAQSFHGISNEARRAGLMMREEMKNLTEQASRVLESHQIHQMELYVPCIIPPKGEARIGQAADFKGLSRSLERLRELPARVYSMRRRAIAQRTLDALKLRAAPGTNGDERELLGRIVSITDRARALDEAEFTIQKESLAEEMAGLLKQEIPAGQLDRKIEGFLLSPEMIRLLEERLSTNPLD